MRKEVPNFWSIGKILLTLFIISSLASMFFGSGNDDESTISDNKANVAIIPVKGVIMVEGNSNPLGGTSVASSDRIIKEINKAKNSPNIKAIIFEINSPGGGGVASDEVGQAIKESNLTTVSVIREMGTSGAYWIASATDHIIANRMSLTGSIGVIGSYLDFSGLLEDFNITYKRFVAGKYKDIRSPMREITNEESKIYQGILDKMHDFFITEVAANRGLSEKETRELATGLFYLGSEALELGLIDELGTIEDAKNYIEKELDIEVVTTEFKEKKSITDILSQLISKNDIGLQKFIYNKPQLLD
ncbi:signal peptide peptidase SppA [archaeon]|jgi:protease IV|nr:signal peptide peptidase SppA [Cryomorphaceae bacterium]MBT4648664.1 signal peptide peptidase SppA [archaeon]MBT6821788.1 signal peptide peptidase SppA [archaeon]MBT7391183.1 signal peptide peptidase SppA [archaeon]